MARHQEKVAPVAALLELGDSELAEAALSNWHQLNYVLKHRQSPALIQRLIDLEHARTKNNGPRRNVLVRLARALTRAEGRERLAKL